MNVQHVKSPCWLNGSMEGYPTNAEFEARMADLAALYPHLLSQGRELGRSVNNQSIYAYRLGRRPRPALLVASMLYARDVTALVTLMYSIEQLCRRFTGGEDAALRRALEAVSIVFVPVVNVDAFVDDTRKHKHGGGDTVKNLRPWMAPGGLRDFRVFAANCAARLSAGRQLGSKFSNILGQAGAQSWRVLGRVSWPVAGLGA
jgi:hypothetical protein